MNTSLTIISAFLTLGSFICSIFSFRNAKKAGQYKNEVLNLRDALEIKGITEKFIEAYLKFRQETRSDNWFQGKSRNAINAIISPLESALSSLAAIYPLMDNAIDLKSNVGEVSSSIVQFDQCHDFERKMTFSRLGEIENSLQEMLHKQTVKTLK